MIKSPTSSVDPISSAMDLFWERGYVATSLSDLLARMRVSRKRIYSTYGSKEALFQAVLQAYVQREALPRMACLMGPERGLAAVEAYLRSWTFSSDFRGCLLWNSVAEKENLSPEANGIVKAYFEQLRAALLENFVAAKNRGQLSNEATPVDLTNLALNTAMGMSLMGKMVGDAEASEHMLNLLLSGMRPKRSSNTHPATAC